MDVAKKTQQKVISACFVGKPNSGKSTLLNKIIGQKISIVTPKVQTTRSVIRGIVTIENTQIILTDTPGVFDAKKRLEKSMVKCAWSSIASADIAIFILDSSTKISDFISGISSKLKELEQKTVFLLNKIDLNSKYYIENLNYVNKNFPRANKFNISALTGAGIDNFIDFLKNNAREKKWLYKENKKTNASNSFLATEITREQLFLKLHQELPYNLTVKNERWQMQKNGSLYINQTIIVAKEGYKNMIIGKKAKRIKEIGSIARKNIEKLMGIKVHLFLFVKARESWDDKFGLYNFTGPKLSKEEIAKKFAS